ncbi:MAG: prephenate dehydrogenase [Kiritimatiellae bacterium]|nr:prephenate dehydrogenase [Kiritimatiellia bacterium]
MNVAIAGLGLIGGSFLKAAEAAGHKAKGCHHGEREDFSWADIIIVAMPPSAIEPWIRANEATFRSGAIVVDVCGVKRPLFEAFKETGKIERPWHFVPGHPMAGKEVGGFANATPDLYKGASMILTPYPYMGRGPLDTLEEFFRSLGFGRVVVTTPAHHDEMIAFTSQLCHIISSAYVREPLALDATGFTAGSFRDMVRVGAPDPEVWSELFTLNRDALLPVLERYISRLESFRAALASNDPTALKRDLAEGVEAKKEMSRQ